VYAGHLFRGLGVRGSLVCERRRYQRVLARNGSPFAFSGTFGLPRFRCNDVHRIGAAVKLQKWQWTTGLSVLLMVVVLPIFGHWARHAKKERCALDGNVIQPIFRVRIIDSLRRVHQFCCVRCAELWIEHLPDEPRDISVTDEVSGQEIDATNAYFVRSSVITVPATGNRVHVFRTESDAAKHAASAQGRMMRWAERPFHTESVSPFGSGKIGKDQNQLLGQRR
jgi:hypothetical protein